MKYLQLYEKFHVDSNITNILKAITPRKIISNNEWLQNEIIHYMDEIIEKEMYFLRDTMEPIDDLKVGFSACFHNKTPYTDTLDQALDILRNEITEDDNHPLRFMKWKDNSNYQETKLYDLQLFKEQAPDTCYPVYDIRQHKYLVNPEFGLSAYIIENNRDIEDIISNHYMKGGNDNKNKWHIFKSKYYHYHDSDSGKESVYNGDDIVCFLKGEYICSLDDLIKNIQ